MMAFGWRPPQSCYGKGGTTPGGQPTCPNVTWFYVLAVLAFCFGGKGSAR